MACTLVLFLPAKGSSGALKPVPVEGPAPPGWPTLIMRAMFCGSNWEGSMSSGSLSETSSMRAWCAMAGGCCLGLRVEELGR